MYIVEKLLKELPPYGQVEAILLGPSLHRHTVIFDCGCQAEKATSSLLAVEGPFTPQPNFAPHNSPRKFDEYKTSKDCPKVSVTLPQFFRVIMRGSPSVAEVIAFLSREIGEFTPNGITWMKESFDIKTEKDAQSLILFLMDFSKSGTTQKVYPHQN